VGHLGIFVSASVALHQHHAILSSLDTVEALAPGLYEMVLDRAEGAMDARFERRRVEDLKFAAPRAPFERVRELSERGVQAYESFVGPCARAAASPWVVALLKWFHPMRASRWMFSARFNPCMAGVAAIAPFVAEQRRLAAPDNPL